MKPADVQRIAEALRMQRSHLCALLDFPERDADNFHLALAGVLRSMLCDADWPTLLVLAREMSVSLRVWGPYPPEATNERPPTFAFNALVASAEPVWGGHEMSAEEYLGAPIGSVSFGGVGEPTSSSWYTPKQLIKWAANKEGASHFDPKLPATFQSIGTSIISTGSVTMLGPSGSTPITQNDNLPVRIALLQISQWAVAATDQVLVSYARQGV
jgi:hypothetical protein